jgi:glycosyltransferase involved in cell wall biosynthesis
VPNLLLVTVGRGEPAVADHVARRHLDRLNDDAALSLVYSAADVFAIPSLQDNLPNTVLEAMACGVPVVGFDVGGIPELVRPGVTGLLAPPRDADALGNAIGRLLHDSAKRAEMGLNCRRIAAEEYALGAQARRYRALYHQVTGSQRSRFSSETLRTSSARS